MEREMVSVLIEKFTQRISYKLAKTVRRLVILLFVLSTCLLLTLKNYVFVLILFILTVSEFVYITKILKNGTLSLYNGVGVSLVLLVKVVLSFNIWLYSFQKLTGFYEPILLIVIFTIEGLCFACGFSYTCWCMKTGTVRKNKMGATVSVTFVIPSAFGYFFSKCIINGTSANIQGIILTIIFALINSMLMFTIGMSHVAILYYAKKYNIADKELSNNI